MDFNEEIKKVDKKFTDLGYSKQALYKTYIPALKAQNYQGDWTEKCLRIRELGCAMTKNKMVELYGEKIGTEKWENYRKKQAYSNSKEYKGMSEKEFKEYNLSRAVTLENMIKKYGEEEGKKKFDDYCQKQSYTNSLEYFIEKYGEEGKEKWEKYNFLKGHSLGSYTERLGKEEGFKKYSEYCENIKSFHYYFSKVASDLFEKIENELQLEKCYYAPKTKEFGLWCKELNSYVFYDFVIPDWKLCIEFNGNCFHANPKIYKSEECPNPFVKNLTAKEIWEKDKIKIDNIIKNGYNVIIIWENDVNYETLIEEIKKYDIRNK